MAGFFQTDDGQLLIEPSAVASFRAAASSAGLPTTGVVALFGEAAAGPDFTIEGADLDQNSFGPDEDAEVAAKYGSGPVVDAFRATVRALNDVTVAALGRDAFRRHLGALEDIAAASEARHLASAVRLLQRWGRGAPGGEPHV